MLDFMVSWAEQLIITLMIIVIIEMILPSESSYRKYIKVILGVFLIYTIISPILTKKLNNLEFMQILATEEIAMNSVNEIDNDKQIEDTYKQKLKEDLTEFLKERGYGLVKYDFDLKYKEERLEINNLTIKIKKISNKSKVAIDKVIIAKKSKIDASQLENLKNEISDYYDIDAQKISISESENAND